MSLYETSSYKSIFPLNVGFCVIAKIILFCEYAKSEKNQVKRKSKSSNSKETERFEKQRK